MWVPLPHGAVPQVHSQCLLHLNEPGEGPSYPGLAPTTISQGNPTLPRIRQFLTQINPRRQFSLCPPHFHSKPYFFIKTQVSVLEPRSSSGLQEAPEGLLHCSHPHTTRCPSPIHCGSGGLHHRHGSSAVPTTCIASSSPPLRLLFPEAFPGRA